MPEEARGEPQRNASPQPQHLAVEANSISIFSNSSSGWLRTRVTGVIIEEPVLAGIGSVDVTLERKGHRIACEISVSSTSDYEFRNIQVFGRRF